MAPKKASCGSLYVKRDMGRNSKGWKQKTVVSLKFVVQCLSLGITGMRVPHFF